MNSFYNKTGIRIRELRETNRYTREKFAEVAGISPKFLYEIETGQKGFSADTLYRIAKALSVTCEYILSGDTCESHNSDVFDSLKLFDNSQLMMISQLLKLIYEISLHH